MGIMVACIFKRPLNIGAPMDTGSKNASSHLPNSTAFIMDKHFRGYGNHLIFPWATGPFFAPITR
jgi:hypothetical protein